MSARIDTDIGPDVPPVRDLAAGALFLRGPEELIIAWAIILVAAILSSSVGLVPMLVVILIAPWVILVGFLWLGYRRWR